MIAQIFIKLASWGFTVGFLVLWIEKTPVEPSPAVPTPYSDTSRWGGPARHPNCWLGAVGPTVPGGPGLGSAALALPAQLPGLWDLVQSSYSFLNLRTKLQAV